MIKISNAIPRDMTTDCGDCWLLLKLGVSVPSSTAGRAGAGQSTASRGTRQATAHRQRGLRSCARDQARTQGPTVEGGRPAARSSPARPGGGRTRPWRAGRSNSHCPSADGPLKPSPGPLTSGDARLQQAGAVQREAGRGHGGERQQGLRRGGGWAGAGGAGLEHADGRRLLRGRGALSGVLIVRQVDPLAEAGPRGLAGGEVAVRGQQALAEALPAAGSRSPQGSAPTTGGP